jgi:hypothetical protein
MMNEDKQFDDYLRSQFGQKQFEQKDRYWVNAQNMIDAQRRGRSKALLAFTFSAVVLVSLSVGLLWKLSDKASNEVALVANTSTLSAAQAMADASLSLNGPGNAMGSNGNSNTQATNNSKKSPANPSITSQAAATASTVAVLTSYTSAQPITSVTQKADRTTHKSKAEKRAAKLGDKNTREAATKTNNASAMEMIGSRFFRSSIPSKNAIDSFSKKDITLAYSIRQQRSFLTTEAGINCYNLNKDVLNSFNFHAGLRYYYFVSHKIGLSAGIGYSRQHQDLVTRTYRDIDYSFGQTAVETKITTMRLDYIELPVSMHYRVNGNHFATIGAMMNYAIRSSEYVETGSTSNGTRDNGYMEAINKFDVQLNLGYNCLINDRYTFSAGYYFGLMDVSNNTAFKSDKFDRNTGIRLSLGYKLF